MKTWLPILASTRRLCSPFVRLAELAAGVPGAVVETGGETEIGGISYDSRSVRPGDLFVAVAGL